MAVAHIYRITFKQRNCTGTIKQDEITHNESHTASDYDYD